jgi:hypothetical protein
MLKNPNSNTEPMNIDIYAQKLFKDEVIYKNVSSYNFVNYAKWTNISPPTERSISKVNEISGNNNKA